MNDIKIRDLIVEWVKRDEKHKVLAALIENRVSATTADQLVRAKYPSEPSGTLRTVLEGLLKQAGLIDEAAS